MTRPGTLYWFCPLKKRHLEMLVGTRKAKKDFPLRRLSARERENEIGERENEIGERGIRILDGETYEHTLLIADGEIVTIESRTENLEDDFFWGKCYERIEL